MRCWRCAARRLRAYHVDVVGATAAVRAVGREVTAAADLAVDGRADVTSRGEPETGDGGEENRAELHDCYTVGWGGAWMVFGLSKIGGDL